MTQDIPVKHSCCFDACIIGNPKPEVTWRINNQVVESGTNIDIRCHDNEHIMSIIETSEELSGTYSVEAVNLKGKVDSQAYLNILGMSILYFFVLN